MQGSYTNNGLPRPYYMKPSKRGAYDKLPRLVFLTNSRKLTGYLIMLVVFGLCVFMIGQELRPQPDAGYELVSPDAEKPKAAANGVADSTLAEDTNEKSNLGLDKGLDKGLNKGQYSKGEYGRAVMEAPKGGLVNEGRVVGTDEDYVVEGRVKGTGDGKPGFVAQVQAGKEIAGDAAAEAASRKKDATEPEQADAAAENKKVRGVRGAADADPVKGKAQEEKETKKEEKKEETKKDGAKAMDLSGLNDPIRREDKVQKILEESNH